MDTWYQAVRGVDRARPPEAPPATAASPAIERYVAECEALLWSRAGRPQRSYRGFGDEVRIANRVGADPGPRQMARPAGLPRGEMGVVLPVLDDHGQATYLQTRYLDLTPTIERAIALVARGRNGRRIGHEDGAERPDPLVPPSPESVVYKMYNQS